MPPSRHRSRPSEYVSTYGRARNHGRRRRRTPGCGGDRHAGLARRGRATAAVTVLLECGWRADAYANCDARLSAMQVRPSHAGPRVSAAAPVDGRSSAALCPHGRLRRLARPSSSPPKTRSPIEHVHPVGTRPSTPDDLRLPEVEDTWLEIPGCRTGCRVLFTSGGRRRSPAGNRPLGPPGQTHGTAAGRAHREPPGSALLVTPPIAPGGRWQTRRR